MFLWPVLSDHEESIKRSCFCVFHLVCVGAVCESSSLSAPLSQPLIGIHSRLIIHTEVGGYSKLSTTQAPTEIPLTANELFPYYVRPSLYVHKHTHTKNTYAHVSHFLTIFLMAQS